MVQAIKYDIVKNLKERISGALAIVLVDYKTDKVSPGGEQDLIDLYHIQLEDYAAALERMLQKKVKETYIYSFTLRKMIPLS